MMGGNFKLSNNLGAPFREFVSYQLKTRSVLGTRKNRTLSEALYLGNQLAWVRLQSSVEVKQEYLDVLKQGFADEPGSFDEGAWTSTGLARNWVLQSGTSKTTGEINMPLPNAGNLNLGEIRSLRGGIGYDGAYGLGGIKAQGYRPMPGITNVQIESAGKLGSLRYATINFKVWNMNQLDIMDALYFRMGYTMLLEWGHAQYFENLPDFTNPQRFEKLISNTDGIDGFFNSTVTKENIQLQINRKTVETQGNYDGMLGTVTNFEYSFNQEGGWDCSIKLIGLGSIMESQKINISYTFPPGLSKVWDRTKKIIQKSRRDAINRQVAIENSKIINGNVSAAKTDRENYDANYPVHNVVDYYKLVLNPKNTNGTGWQNTDFTNKTYQYTLINKGKFIPIADLITLSQTHVYKNINGYKRFTQASGLWEENSAYWKDNILRFAYGTSNDNGWRYGVRPGSPIGLNNNVLSYITLAANKSRDNSYEINDINGIYPPLYGSFISEIVSVKPFSYLGADKKVATPGFDNLEISSTLGEIIANTYRFKSFSAGKKDIALEDNLRITDSGFITEITPFGLNRGNSGEYIFQHAYSLLTNTNIPSTTKPNETINAATTTTLRAYISDFSFLNPDDVISYDSLFDNLAEILKSDPNQYSGWIVDKVESLWEGGNILFSESAYREGISVTMSKTFTLVNPNITYYNTTGNYNLLGPSKNPKTYTGQGTITVTLVTSMLNVISDIGIPSEYVYKKSIVDTPLVNGTYAGTELDSTAQAIGLESSLQAMLTLIKYKTIADNPNPKKLIKHSIKDITGLFLTEGSGSLAPLAAIFKDSKTIDTGSVITSVSKNDPNDLFRNPVTLGIKGYNTALMQDYNYTLINNTTSTTTPLERYNQVPSVNFEELFNSYMLPKYILQSATDSPNIQSEYQVYIPFGYLLFFLNCHCLLYDTSKSSPGVALKDGANAARPIIYIDFNPSTNLCMTMPSQLTSDPGTCLIPYSGQLEDYKKLFIQSPPPPNLFDPKISAAYCSVIQGSFRGGDQYQGKTMDILLNVDYLLNLIRATANKDGHNNVYLQPFLDDIVTAVNKSLGDINAFRVAYVDASNTVAVLDDQYIPPISGEQPTIFDKDAYDTSQELGATANGKSILQMPVYGKESLARSFTFQTDTSTKMSRAIAIGAQAVNSGSVQGVDASSYWWLNQGLTDRIITVKNNVTQANTNPAAVPSTKGNKTGKKNSTPTTPLIKEDPNILAATKFNQHVKSTYTSDKTNIYSELVDPARNFLIQGTTKVKANTSGSSGTLAIPLNATMTLTGISGIGMGNAFLLPEKILPITLRGTKTQTRFGFYVMGLGHTLESNQWITSIKGQIVKIRADKNTYEANPNPALQSTTSLNGSTTLDELRQLIIDNPAFLAYLQHQQGQVGTRIILYHTFLNPQSIITTPFDGFKTYTSVTGIMANLANNYNVNDAITQYGATARQITPENFLRYQLFKYTKLYNEAQTKNTYDKYFNDTLFKNSTTLSIEDIRVACIIESSFDPTKHNQGSSYYGLFQITLEDFKKEYPNLATTALTDIFDPEKNATVGIKLLIQNNKLVQELIDTYIR